MLIFKGGYGPHSLSNLKQFTDDQMIRLEAKLEVVRKNLNFRNFGRKPRELKDIHLWKASEYRVFFLYCMIPLLADETVNFKEPIIWELLKCLHFSICILENPTLSQQEEWLQKAEKMLHSFLQEIFLKL